MNQSVADKSYRRAALPLAIFMLVAGVAFGIAAVAFPAESIFVPPFKAEVTKRTLFLATGIFVFVMGMGFLMRRLWALYALVAYMLVGTVWHVAVALADPTWRGLLCSPLVSLPITYAIYRITQPALGLERAEGMGESGDSRDY